jgi:hypothetical protein
MILPPAFHWWLVVIVARQKFAPNIAVDQKLQQKPVQRQM